MEVDFNIEAKVDFVSISGHPFEKNLKYIGHYEHGHGVINIHLFIFPMMN